MPREMTRPVTFDSEWTRVLESSYHWQLYWQQLKLIEDLVFGERMRVLEIGVGSGLLRTYLESKGHGVMTVDVDPGKKPDVVADIRTYEPTERFDLVLACNVFEHFPFCDLAGVLGRLHRCCAGHLAVGLPDYRRALASMDLKVPGLPRLRLAVPRLSALCWRPLAEHHHWEVNHRSHTVGLVLQQFAEAGFDLARRDAHGRHRFFRFRKQPREGDDLAMAALDRQEEAWWDQFAKLEERKRWTRYPHVVRATRPYLRDAVAELAKPGGQVLEIGCGTGYIGAHFLKAGMKLVGIDVSKEQVEIARRQHRSPDATFLTARLDDFQWDRTFDVVVVHGLLHHLTGEEVGRILARIAQLTGPGGRVFLSEPISATPPTWGRALYAILTRIVWVLCKTCQRLVSRRADLVALQQRQADQCRIKGRRGSPKERALSPARLREAIRPYFSVDRAYTRTKFATKAANALATADQAAVLRRGPACAALLAGAALDWLCFELLRVGHRLTPWQMTHFYLTRR